MKMKNSTCLSLLLALSLCLPTSQVWAQESVSKALFEAGNKALSLGQYKEAEKKLRLALKEAETGSASADEVESILRQLVKVLEAQGQLSDAISLQEKLIALDKNGKDPAQLLSDLCSLASNLKEKDEFKAAEEKYNEAMALIDGKESVKLGKTVNKDESKVTLLLNMSGLYLEQSILDKAQMAAKSALSLAEKMEASALKTKLQIECLDALGHIYIRQAGFDQAESCLQRALSLCNENASKKDKAHILLGLAQVKYEQGSGDAETLIKQCLELPDSDIAVQTEAMYLLVSILSAQNKNAEALKILEKCMAMQEKVYGKESPNLAVCIRKLAGLLIDMNDYNRAEMLINRAIAVDKKVGGSNSASDLSTLGMLYLRQGKYAQAEAPYKEALTLAEQKKGDSHPDVAACLNNLAWLYSNQSKFEEAQSLIERGLAIRQKSLGENHPATARNIANLAKILIEQRKYSEAIPQLEKAYEIQKDILGAEHQDTINTLSELSEALFLSKQFPQAEENFRALLEADKKLEGDKSSKVAWDMENLGKVLAAQEKTDEAKVLIASAKTIKARLPGFIQNTGNPEESRGIFRQNPQSQNIPARPVKDKWALVVGVSNFKDSSINLQYAAKDATDFYNYLITEAHFAPDHVKLLLDKNATRENITGNLGEKWLGKVADKDDLVVIYLSSHGTSSRGDTNYIVAYETNLNNVIFTGISMQSFTTGINDILKSDRVVVVMDVCHGGAVRTDSDLDNIARRKEEPARIAIASADVNGMKGLIRSPEITGKNMGNIVGKGQIVLASSEADQVSWESTSYPNGVFTRRLIEGLRLNGEKTTVMEAFKHMRQKVEQEVLKDRSEIQTPIAVTNSWQGSDIPLAIKVVSPRKPF